MSRTTAVLDVGKTNIKLLVFRAGTIVFRRSAPNVGRPAPPYPHVDTEAIWQFCLAALGEAAREHRIEAVIVTTHGATVTMVGESDLAAPVMDYEYAGPDGDEPDYAPLRPPFGETLTPQMPGGLNWARQVLHIQRHHPDLFDRTRHILMYPQYFGWRLTGVARNEVTSLACHSDAWNPQTGTPSTLVERLGWTTLLPPVVPAWAELGPITPEVAARTGLPAGTPVLAGLHDSNASLIPHLLSLPAPFTVISTGTWVVIFGIGAALDSVVEGTGAMANVDAMGRSSPVVRFMGGREYALLTEGAGQDADEADLDAVLASGVMALPSFTPHAGPIRTQGHIDGEMPDRSGARAALATLYEALFTDHQLDVLGAAAGPLVVEGPFAASALFCGVLAALRPTQSVLVDADIAGSAYGAALLADWPARPDRPPLRSVAPYLGSAALLPHKRRWRAWVDQLAQPAGSRA